MLLASAVAAGLAALAPAPPPVRPMVVAAHDLAVGAVLTSDDLAVSEVPAAALPASTFADPNALVGRSVAGPMRRGEPFTDVRLVGPDLLLGATGMVAAPVRLADAAAAALLRPGDLVDVLAAGSVDAAGLPGGLAASAEVVAGGVRVLAVPATDPASPGSAGSDGALVVLAVTPSTAVALAGAAASARLSVAIRRSGDTAVIVR